MPRGCNYACGAVSKVNGFAAIDASDAPPALSNSSGRMQHTRKEHTQEAPGIGCDWRPTFDDLGYFATTNWSSESASGADAQQVCTDIYPAHLTSGWRL